MQAPFPILFYASPMLNKLRDAITFTFASVPSAVSLPSLFSKFRHARTRGRSACAKITPTAPQINAFKIAFN